MNENGTQIFMINMIFSFSLRSLRPLRFIFRGDFSWIKRWR
jgi:hypothetical protein